MVQFDPAQSCCAGKLPWGMYFNKATPCIAVKIPPIQAPLPAFQLRPDEAVVVIGATPPLRAFRITPTGSGSSRPFGTPALRTRGTGRTEMDLTPGLNQLRQAILDSFGGYNTTEYVTRPIGYDGFDPRGNGLQRRVTGNPGTTLSRR
jgi:hypothetical protein